MKKQPTIHFGRNDHGQECWKLSCHEGPVSIQLQIRFFHGSDNPHHYTLLAAHDDEQINSQSHGYRQVITHEELDIRFNNILAHEGLEAARAWKENARHHFMVVGKFNKILRIGNELKGCWEQVCSIVNPHVTF